MLTFLFIKKKCNTIRVELSIYKKKFNTKSVVPSLWISYANKTLKEKEKAKKEKPYNVFNFILPYTAILK